MSSHCYHCEGPIDTECGQFALCLQCGGQIHRKCDWIPCNPGRNPKGRGKPKETNEEPNQD